MTRGRFVEGMRSPGRSGSWVGEGRLRKSLPLVPCDMMKQTQANVLPWTCNAETQRCGQAGLGRTESGGGNTGSDTWD